MKGQKSHINQTEQTHVAVITEGFFISAAHGNLKLVNFQKIHSELLASVQTDLAPSSTYMKDIDVKEINESRIG